MSAVAVVTGPPEQGRGEHYEDDYNGCKENMCNTQKDIYLENTK